MVENKTKSYWFCFLGVDLGSFGDQIRKYRLNKRLGLFRRLGGHLG